MAQPRTTLSGAPRRPFYGLLGPLPIVWRLPPGIGHDPQEWEGSTQHRAPSTSAGSQGEGKGVLLGRPTAPSSPAGPRVCPTTRHLSAPFLATPWQTWPRPCIRRPPCRRPALLQRAVGWSGPREACHLPAPNGGVADEAMGRRCRASHDRCIRQGRGLSGLRGGGGCRETLPGRQQEYRCTLGGEGGHMSHQAVSLSPPPPAGLLSPSIACCPVVSCPSIPSRDLATTQLMRPHSRGPPRRQPPPP